MVSSGDGSLPDMEMSTFSHGRKRETEGERDRSLPLLFLSFFFFCEDHFKSPHWICSNNVSVLFFALCFGFLAVRHVGSYLPDQGLNLYTHS